MLVREPICSAIASNALLTTTVSLRHAIKDNAQTARMELQVLPTVMAKLAVLIPLV